jgi:hypothetical protein
MRVAASEESRRKLSATVHEGSAERSRLARQLETVTKQSKTQAQQVRALSQKIFASEDECVKLRKNINGIAESVLRNVPQRIGKAHARPHGFLILAKKLLPGSKRARKAEKQTYQAELILGSGLFDSAWYSLRYPDVKNNNQDPLRHFLLYGASEGRAPGPLFNAQQYVLDNPDVAQSKINPLIHYINHGRKEGRDVRMVEEV